MVSNRGARTTGRLVCDPPVVISRRRGSSEIGRSLPRPAESLTKQRGSFDIDGASLHESGLAWISELLESYELSVTRERLSCRGPDLPRQYLVFEVVRIEAVDSAVTSFSLRIHEKSDRRSGRFGQRHIMREVIRHPVHLPRPE